MNCRINREYKFPQTSFPYEVLGLIFMDPNATRDQIAKAGLKWCKNRQNSRK